MKSEKQLCQIEYNGVVHVYMQGYYNVKFEDVDINRTNTYIKCYDFVTVSDGYNYSGERKLVINFHEIRLVDGVSRMVLVGLISNNSELLCVLRVLL